MQIYLNRRISFGLDRIAYYLNRYRPKDITLVDTIDEADLAVLFLDGRLHHNQLLAEDLIRKRKKYACVQIALKSTRNPDPSDWRDLWRDATVVWTYLPIYEQSNFYLSPLGADPESFRPLNLKRVCAIATTGHYTRAECLWEVEQAGRITDQQVIHIEANNDDEINAQYNRCRMVSGLRTKEGFELPAAEGMLAGCRPVLFDTLCFRQWYDGMAEFIPEGSVQETTLRLANLFRLGVDPVSPTEVLLARYRFDWQRIVHGFWERIDG